MELAQPDPDQTLRVSTRISFKTTEPLQPLTEVTNEVLTAYGVLAISTNNATDACVRADNGSYRVDKQVDIDDLYARLKQAAGLLDGEEITFDGVEFRPDPADSEKKPISVYVPVESGFEKLQAFREKEVDIFRSVDAYIPPAEETPKLILAYTANGIPSDAVAQIQDRLEDVETEFTLTIDTDDLVTMKDLGV